MAPNRLNLIESESEPIPKSVKTKTPIPESVKTKKPANAGPATEPRPPPSEGPKKMDSGAIPESVKTKNPRPAKVDNGEKEVWSVEDALAILELIPAFIKEKGVDPMIDGGHVFHDYIKDDLSFETSTSKLMETIGRMKKKFISIGKEGHDPSFSTPSDETSWNLLKKIWGKGGLLVALQAKTLPSKKRKTKDEVVKIQASKKSNNGKDEKEFSKLYPYLCQASMKNRNAYTSMVSKDWLETMERSLCDLEKSKLDELDGAWKDQIVGESQSSVGWISILVKQIRMVKELHSGRG